MTRVSLLIAVLTVTALLSLWLWGCDEPNEPELSVAPYRFATAISLDGTPADVEARGGFVAVSNGTFGALVFARSDTNWLRRIFRYNAGPGARCRQVTLDVRHSYLAVFNDPSDLYHYGVFDFTRDTLAEIPFTPNFNGPLGDLKCIATADTVEFWATDLTPSDRFLAASGMMRQDSASNWQPFWQQRCPSYRPDNGQPRGIAIRDDGLIAVANDDAGIFVYDSRQCALLCSLNTPGIAYDCAWYNDLIVVADQFSVVLVEGAPAAAPAIRATLAISGADRLRGVALDGIYACLLDEADGLYVVSLADTRSPQLVQRVSLPEATGVAADGGRVYVTDQALGLLVYTR